MNKVKDFYKEIDNWLEDKKTRNLNQIEETKTYLLNLPIQLNVKYKEHLNSLVPLRISSLETSVYQLAYAKIAIKQFLNSSDYNKEASTFFHCANELDALDKFFWKQLRKLDKEIATNERLINTNPFPKIFTGNNEKAYELWDKIYNENPSNARFLSFMFHKMKDDKYIDCSNKDFTAWLNQEYEKLIQIKSKYVAETKTVENRNKRYIDLKDSIYRQKS
ncbi:hypothetical protein [Changchengzhania lutea]|uniref:hypothetical protein n=1 Tax=Changchengzhania lutea TaxID=2049305 RepID=UPI00115D47F2|nr:hypothetical protein [Changchengzhania lutea]